MLIRCAQCGKPVYLSGIAGQAECGYCYFLNRKADARILRPEDPDWKEPLYEVAMRASLGKSGFSWLRMLGNYRDAAEKLEGWSREEKTIYQQAYQTLTGALQGGTAHLFGVERAIRSLEVFSGSERNDELLRQLRELQENLKQRQVQEQVAELIHQAENETLLSKLDELRAKLEQCASRTDISSARAVMAEREAWILQRQKERREAEIRARRKKRIRRLLLTAGIVLALITAEVLDVQVLQPRKLEQARTLAAEEKYEEAVEQYLALVTPFLYANDGIRQKAKEELPAVRSTWAARLANRGEWEQAIEQANLANSPETEESYRRIYGELLAEEGRYQEAILQWKNISDGEDHVAELYGLKTLQDLREKDYRTAVSDARFANPEILDREGVTLQSIYREWGFAAADAGNTDEAVTLLGNAGDDPEVIARLTELRKKQYEALFSDALQTWNQAQNGEIPEEDAYTQLQRTGKKLNTLEGQLQYWASLDEAGADISRIFPQGANITDMILPVFQEGEPEAVDTDRPLVLTRTEKEYTVSVLDVLMKEFSLHEGEEYHTWILWPELWQQLPEDRRARCPEECTCFLVLDQSYRYNGRKAGFEVMWDYTSMTERERRSNVKPKTSITFPASFPTFQTWQRLLLWNRGGNQAREIASKRQIPDTVNIRVDWTMNSSLGVSANKLGLAEDFDGEWSKTHLEEASRLLLLREELP